VQKGLAATRCSASNTQTHHTIHSGCLPRMIKRRGLQLAESIIQNETWVQPASPAGIITQTPEVHITTHMSCLSQQCLPRRVSHRNIPDITKNCRIRCCGSINQKQQKGKA